MSEYLIDGKLVADKNKIEITKNVLSLKQKTGIIPGLATILIGDDPASQIYVNRKNKASNVFSSIAEWISNGYGISFNFRI